MASEEIKAPNFLAFDTAGEQLTRRVPVFRPSDRAGDIRLALQGQRYDSAADIAICEDGKLVGMLRMEDLLAAPTDAPAHQIMDPDPPAVAPGVDQEVAAWRAVQHGERSLAVVDAEGRFQGLIPPQRLLAVLLWEHEEDMARLGGFLRDTSTARTATQEPVRRRFWHRLPWLLIGLAGALLAADVVGTFEGRLEANILLAFFIPSIVYLADAVGTQTETLIIRGLSVGVGIGRVVWQELLTGLVVGVALALAFFPFVAWRWGDTRVATVVSLSVLAASTTATVVAMALPWTLNRLGRDPAFGSGPLATVIQDLLSILIYFGIAALVVG